MKLSELLVFLDQKTAGHFICDDAIATFHRVKQHDYPHPIEGEIIQAIMSYQNCHAVDCELLREQAIKALSPLRLKYMADDAPVAAFRMIEGTVIAIDTAYNEQALMNKVRRG